MIDDLINDLSQGRADRESFNYSLLEFFYYSQQGKEGALHRKNVENTLRAFYARYPNQGYVSLLINVVTLLLCFADEKNAFYLLCYMNEKIVPENFWNVNASPIAFVGLLKEKYIVQSALKEVMTLTDFKLFDVTYKKIANALIGSLMVDTVNFNTVITVWEEMFSQKSIKPVQTAIYKVLKYSKNYFEQFSGLTLYNYRLFACRTFQGTLLKNDNSVVSVKDQDRLAQEFDASILNEILNTQDTISNSISLLKDLTPEDLNIISIKIGEVVQNLRIQKKMNIPFAFLTQPTFISILRAAPSLAETDEKELTGIYSFLDFNKEGSVSTRVMAGVIILLVSDDLNKKLTDLFSLFDPAGNKKLSASEMPTVLEFLGEVLTLLNESDPTYLNFHIHLYEMLEKLRKKIKTMDSITPQDFQLIVSKYPVFKVVTREERMFARRSDSIVSFISMNESANDDFRSDDEGRDQDFDDLPEEVLNRENSEESKKEEKSPVENESPEIIDPSNEESPNDSQADYEYIKEDQSPISAQKETIKLEPTTQNQEEVVEVQQVENQEKADSAGTNKTEEQYVQVDGSSDQSSDKKEGGQPGSNEIINEEPQQEGAKIEEQYVQIEAGSDDSSDKKAEVIENNEQVKKESPKVGESVQQQEIIHEKQNEVKDESNENIQEQVEQKKPELEEFLYERIESVEEKPEQKEESVEAKVEMQQEIQINKDDSPINQPEPRGYEDKSLSNTELEEKVSPVQEEIRNPSQVEQEKVEAEIVQEIRREEEPHQTQASIHHQEVTVEVKVEESPQSTKTSLPPTEETVTREVNYYMETRTQEEEEEQVKSKSSKQVIVESTLDEEDEQLDNPVSPGKSTAIKVKMNPKGNNAPERNTAEEKESSCKMCNIF